MRVGHLVALVVFGVSRWHPKSSHRQQENRRVRHAQQDPSHPVTLERMFLLILLFLFGGVTDDAPPFFEGVVTDECITPDGRDCIIPPSELPGPSEMGGLFRRR